MRVLLLGPEHPAIEECLQACGDEYVRTEEPLAAGSPCLQDIDFIISYGFRHLIPGEVLTPFGPRAINLHIALLPWNRGADPNLWSYLENTPKGVTIHVLDEGLDTGDILVQREVQDDRHDTLRSSYARLTEAIEDLFTQSWPDLRRQSIAPTPQAGLFTVHASTDKACFEHLLTREWDTPVAELVGMATDAPRG